MFCFGIDRLTLSVLPAVLSPLNLCPPYFLIEAERTNYTPPAEKPTCELSLHTWYSIAESYSGRHSKQCCYRLSIPYDFISPKGMDTDKSTVFYILYAPVIMDAYTNSFKGWLRSLRHQMDNAI